MQFIYLLLAIALSSPTTSDYTRVNREVFDVQSLDVDSNMYYTILPYKTELDAQMNAVLCHSIQEMKKQNQRVCLAIGLLTFVRNGSRYV